MPEQLPVAGLERRKGVDSALVRGPWTSPVVLWPSVAHVKVCRLRI